MTTSLHLASVLCALAAVGCGPSRGNQAARVGTTHGDSTQSQGAVGELFWAGISEHGPWLVYLAPRDSGAFYDPVRPIAICDLQTTPTGAVAFRSASFGAGTIYQFEGRRSGSSLTGTMKRVRHRTGAVVDSQQITLDRITLSSSNQSVSGDYVAVRGNEQSGDITGIELVLADTGQGFVGVMVVYDGGAGDLREVSGNRADKLLHITMRSSDRSETDTGTLRGDTLVMYGGRFKLIKKRSLGAVFRGPYRLECDAALR